MSGLATGCWISDERLTEAQDRDGDGFLPVALGGDDCDDDAAGVHPEASELCDDGIDNDCDGLVDDFGLGNRTYYVDGDEDGYGREITALLACTPPPGHVTLVGDCDDEDGERSPAAVDVCNGVDDDCDDVVDEDAQPYVQYRDADGDGQGTFTDSVVQCAPMEGYVTTVGDCDDANPLVFVGAGDFSCDGIDDNCNGIADEDATYADYLPDGDGDGWGTDEALSTRSCLPIPGHAPRGGDCDDANPTVSPGERDNDCDGVDDDCDGLLDQGAVFVDYYPDADGDQWGSNDQPAVASCTPLPNHTPQVGDCDDDDETINQGANDDNCDGLDNDCDGIPDDDAVFVSYFVDADLDGWGDDATEVVSCSVFVDRVIQGGDCDDHDQTRNPGENEVCDGTDNNCSGFADENLPVTLYYDDLDGDGFGDPSTGEISCAANNGRVLDATDCNDADSTVNTSAVDSCDGIDTDCDGTNDDDAPFVLWFPDNDSDSFGDGTAPELRCDVPNGYVTNSLDCNDDNDRVSVRTWYRDDDGDGQGTTPNNECQQPPGYASVPGDCDDTNPSVRRFATEVCGDGLDNDCNLFTDCSWSGTRLSTEADTTLVPAPNEKLGVLDDVNGDQMAEFWRATANKTHFYIGGPTLPDFTQTGDLEIDGRCDLERIPDIDQDQFPDLLCATPGKVQLFGGASLRLLATYTSTNPGFGEHWTVVPTRDSIWISSIYLIHQMPLDTNGATFDTSSNTRGRVQFETLDGLASATLPNSDVVMYINIGFAMAVLVNPTGRILDVPQNADILWDYYPTHVFEFDDVVLGLHPALLTNIYDISEGAPRSFSALHLEGTLDPLDSGVASAVGLPNEPLVGTPMVSPTRGDYGWALNTGGGLPRTAVVHNAAQENFTLDADAWFVDPTTGGELRLETAADVDADGHRDLVFRTSTDELLIFIRRLE